MPTSTQRCRDNARTLPRGRGSAVTPLPGSGTGRRGGSPRAVSNTAHPNEDTSQPTASGAEERGRSREGASPAGPAPQDRPGDEARERRGPSPPPSHLSARNRSDRRARLAPAGRGAAGRPATYREAGPEGAGVADAGRGGERQRGEADGHDEAAEHHLRDPQGQHGPRAGAVLAQAGQAAGQRGGAEGARPAGGARRPAAAHRHPPPGPSRCRREAPPPPAPPRPAGRARSAGQPGAGAAGRRAAAAHGGAELLGCLRRSARRRPEGSGRWAGQGGSRHSRPRSPLRGWGGGCGVAAHGRGSPSAAGGGGPGSVGARRVDPQPRSPLRRGCRPSAEGGGERERQGGEGGRVVYGQWRAEAAAGGSAAGAGGPAG